MRLILCILVFTSLALARKPAAPRPSLLAASKEGESTTILDKRSSALVVGATASAVSASSVALIMFALFHSEPVPSRSLAAASATLSFAVLLEKAGFTFLGSASLRGFIFSEVGQWLAIGSLGWFAFSIMWASGYGSVLTPGQKPPLNAAAIGGTLLGALLYAQGRPPSLSHTILPFASAMIMQHLHLIVTPDVQEYRLAPLALSSALVALVAFGVEHLVHQGSGYFAGVRGSETVVVIALCANIFWTLLTLSKWTFLEAPYWGFATVAVALFTVQVVLHSKAQADSVKHQVEVESWARSWDEATNERHLLSSFPPMPPWRVTFSRVYEVLAWWLGLLAGHRAVWVGDEGLMGHLSPSGRLERHFYSLVITFGLWSATSASQSKLLTASLAAGMVAVTIGLTLYGSMFGGEPLLRAGALGLMCGATLLAGLAHLLGEDTEDTETGASSVEKRSCAT